MLTIPRILITLGEPAGIGPEITAQIAQQSWHAELICVCDPALLQSRASQINQAIKLKLFDPTALSTTHKPGTLYYIPVKLPAPCVPGKLSLQNTSYVIECLKVATDYCLNHSAALVTGPIQKSIMNEAGINFTGHTEFLAQYCNTQHPVMLFVSDHIRVALATTHLPLKQVPQAITAQLLTTTLKVLHHELQTKFHLANPKIMVCGLNPHAGENGHLGEEEINIITPVLNDLRKNNFDIIGPLPADTVFTEKYLNKSDAILSMYHDQALPVIKHMSFGHAVNVTLGLPIIRTSVDHGTALDIAGTPDADSGSLSAAVALAIKMLSKPSPLKTK